MDQPGASKPFEPVTDLYAYLQGCWCRNLEWREFGGGFRHLHSSNTLVVIEAVGEGEGEPQPEGTRLLRWSFGKSLAREDLHEAYVMKLSSTDGETSMESLPASLLVSPRLSGGRCLALACCCLMLAWCCLTLACV